MKKSLIFLVAMFVLSAIPAAAQQQYCFGGYGCQYLVDVGFSLGGWTYDANSSAAYVADTCVSGSTWAAEIYPGEQAYQEFNAEVEEDTNFEDWVLEFDVYKDATGSAFDYVEVTVLDLDVPANSETYRVYADEMTGNCATPSIPLASNFAGHDLRVRLKKGSSTTIGMWIDNVTFWGVH